MQVSALALGTMNFGNPTSKKESMQIIDAAIDKISDYRYGEKDSVKMPKQRIRNTNRNLERPVKGETHGG